MIESQLMKALKTTCCVTDRSSARAATVHLFRDFHLFCVYDPTQQRLFASSDLRLFCLFVRTCYIIQYSQVKVTIMQPKSPLYKMGLLLSMVLHCYTHRSTVTLSLMTLANWEVSNDLQRTLCLYYSPCLYGHTVNPANMSVVAP